jgi:SSS family solute:Na+ symporter
MKYTKRRLNASTADGYLKGEAKSAEEHIQWLRLSILLVTVLVFLWSWLVPTFDFIFMFMALSGTIWQGGAGTCIIGGLYWAKGNTNGAWAGLGVGASIGIGGIIASVYCTRYCDEPFPVRALWGG